MRCSAGHNNEIALLNDHLLTAGRRLRARELARLALEDDAPAVLAGFGPELESCSCLMRRLLGGPA